MTESNSIIKMQPRREYESPSFGLIAMLFHCAPDPLCSKVAKYQHPELQRFRLRNRKNRKKMLTDAESNVRQQALHKEINQENNEIR